MILEHTVGWRTWDSCYILWDEGRLLEWTKLTCIQASINLFQHTTRTVYRIKNCISSNPCEVLHKNLSELYNQFSSKVFWQRYSAFMWSAYSRSVALISDLVRSNQGLMDFKQVNTWLWRWGLCRRVYVISAVVDAEYVYLSQYCIWMTYH